MAVFPRFTSSLTSLGLVLGLGGVARGADSDADVLAQQILKIHPRGDDPALASRVRQAAEAAPEGESSDARIVHLLKVAASAQDNTTFISIYQDAIGYSTAPLHAYDFEDGLTILRAEAAALVGARVLKIAGRPVNEVRAAIAPTIAASSEGIRRLVFARRAFCPELLHAVGLSPERDRFEVTVRTTDGSTLTETLQGSKERGWRSLADRTTRRVPDDLVARHFWFREAPQQNAVVAEIRAVRDEPDGQSIGVFAAAVAKALIRNPDARLVLDLRYGGGGSGHAMTPLVEAVMVSPQARKPGRIFVIIGRMTSGTVLEYASVIRNVAPVVFVGEAASAGPNGVGDPTQVVLPNSGIVARVTEVEWPTTLSEEGPAALAPDISVAAAAADYLAGRDPALEAALVATAADRIPTGAVATASNTSDWEGLYTVGPGQIVRIHPRAGRMWFALEDAGKLVGRNFIAAESPLFLGPNETLTTLLKGVSVARAGDRYRLVWRGAERAMTPTFWGFERIVLGAMIVLGIAFVAVVALIRSLRRT